MCIHFENGSMLHVDFNSTTIDRFDDGIGVLLRKFSRQVNVDNDPFDPFCLRIPFTPHCELEIFSGDVSILAEREDINPRTCTNRDQKKIKGRRDRSFASLIDRLVGLDVKSLVICIHPLSTRESDLHILCHINTPWN